MEIVKTRAFTSNGHLSAHKMENSSRKCWSGIQLIVFKINMSYKERIYPGNAA
jgi:hypothetical protein